MRGLKTMFLGFLVMLVGIAWLISLVGAAPEPGQATTNPLVQAATKDAPRDCSSGQCLPVLDYTWEVRDIIQTEEGWSFAIILLGLGIAVLGLFIKERPSPASLPAASQVPQAPVSISSTP